MECGGWEIFLDNKKSRKSCGSGSGDPHGKTTTEILHVVQNDGLGGGGGTRWALGVFHAVAAVRMRRALSVSIRREKPEKSRLMPKRVPATQAESGGEGCRGAGVGATREGRHGLSDDRTWVMRRGRGGCGWLKGASGLHPTLPAPASKLAGDPVRKSAKDGAPGVSCGGLTFSGR